MHTYIRTKCRRFTKTRIHANPQTKHSLVVELHNCVQLKNYYITVIYDLVNTCIFFVIVRPSEG